MGKQRVNVIGLGYIGLPTALMLAAHNQEVVSTLQFGSLTFSEDGMADLFQKAWKNGIRFTTDYVKSDFYIVAVATPFDKTTRKVDAQYVVSAVEQVLSVCAPTCAVDRLLSEQTPGPVIIIESTVSPGTIDRHVRPLLGKYGFRDGVNIHLAHAPERIIPGSMMRELTDNPRTIGADSQEVGERVRQLYASFCRSEITLTDIPLAEISKATEDSYLKLQAIFLDELSDACRVAKVDPKQVIQLVNHYFYSEQRSYIGL